MKTRNASWEKIPLANKIGSLHNMVPMSSMHVRVTAVHALGPTITINCMYVTSCIHCLNQ